MATKITPKMLNDYLACSSSLRRFRQLYPQGLVVTARNIEIAMVKFKAMDWHWLMNYLSLWGLISRGDYEEWLRDSNWYATPENYWQTKRGYFKAVYRKQVAVLFVRIWNKRSK